MRRETNIKYNVDSDQRCRPVLQVKRVLPGGQHTNCFWCKWQSNKVKHMTGHLVSSQWLLFAKENTLTSLGFLLIPVCSYLFNTFSNPMFTLYATMLKIQKILSLPDRAYLLVLRGPQKVFTFWMVLRTDSGWGLFPGFLFCVCYSLFIGVSAPYSRIKRCKKGRVFLRVLLFSHACIIAPMLHTQRHLHFSVTRRTNARTVGIFQKAMLFRK